MSDAPSLVLIPVGIKTVGEMTSIEEVLASFRNLDRLAAYKVCKNIRSDEYRITYPEDEVTGAARHVELTKVDNVSVLGKNACRFKSLVLVPKNGADPIRVELMSSVQTKNLVEERDVAMMAARYARRLIIPSIYLAKDGLDPEAPVSSHAGDVQQALITIAAQHIRKIGPDEPIEWKFAPFSSKHPFLEGRYLGSNHMADAEIGILQDAPRFLMMIITNQEKKITGEIFDSDASEFSTFHLTQSKDAMTVMHEIQLIESIVSDARYQRDER